MALPSNFLVIVDPATNASMQVPREQLVVLQYPMRPRPRHGHGLPVYENICRVMNGSRETIANNLRRFTHYRDAFARIPLQAIPGMSPSDPIWHNQWFESLDAASLYCFLSETKPKRFFEIGGGNSTKFARRAIRDGNLQTSIISVDPAPRADVDVLCDRIIRSGLEDVDLSVFNEVEPGDILFFDGSHYIFMNSDVTVFFLEVFPKLPPGVLVHIHDIWLPADYGMDKYGYGHYYTEQYLLAAYLLGGDRFSNIQMASGFVSQDPELAALEAELWNHPNLAGAHRFGSSFWVITK